MADSTSTKKKKKKADYKVDIWHKAPTIDEQKEMNDLQARLERDGVRVDDETIRRGVVNENIPKYMTLVEKDFADDRKERKEDENFTLTQR